MNTPQYYSSAFGINTTDQAQLNVEVASTGFSVLGMVVTFLICLVGSLGNSLTMCTIIHQCWLPKRMRSIPKLTANMVLIFNLALADFLYCAAALPPVFATYYCNYKNMNCLWLSASMDDTITLCKVSAFFRYYIAICEWTTLGLMAVERCIAIYSFRHKLHHNRLFTPNKTVVMCLFLWLISLIELANLFNNNYDYNEETCICDYKPKTSPNSTCTNGLLNLTSPRVVFYVCSLIPCIFIPIGYFMIFHQIHLSEQQ
ncbi:unnamed protein product, partial [Meganyctiphanes norvegica]